MRDIAPAGSITRVNNAITAAGSPIPKNPFTMPAIKKVIIIHKIINGSVDGNKKSKYSFNFKSQKSITRELATAFLFYFKNNISDKRNTRTINVIESKLYENSAIIRVYGHNIRSTRP